MVPKKTVVVGFFHKDKVKKLKSNLKKHKLANTLIVAFLAYLLISGFYILFNFYFSNRILPGIYIDGKPYGGKTLDEAQRIIKEEYVLNDPITISVNDKTHDLYASDIGFEFLVEETVKDAFTIGREGNLIQNLFDRLKILILRSDVNLQYSYDENKLLLEISDIKYSNTDRFIEPYFTYKNEKVVIIPGKNGLDFDSTKVQNDVIERFVNHSEGTKIQVETYISEPSISNDLISGLLPKVEAIAQKKLVLKYQDESWPLSAEELIDSLEVKKNNDGILELTVNSRKIVDKLNEIAGKINRDPSGQILTVEDGKVTNFKPALDGIRVLVKDNTLKLAENILSSENDVVQDIQIERTTAPEPDDNYYGIKELIGEGHSKFVGSISSRVHNIGLASSRVTGVLVAPGEIFSFNKTVGEVTKKTGYQSAYVISGGRTVLGDGGGLCQVSTTLFRAALDAGLKIVARSPHSYRVGYYEQDSAPGIDATVYSPSVDLKFQNDTEHYILIVSEFNKEKSTLKYWIYGTKDGREVEMSEPKILSRTAPPATIYEEDPSLPKGQTRQIEHAVAGASVVFTRKVTKDGQVLYYDSFNSNYRAWPAVYKVGTKE